VKSSTITISSLCDTRNVSEVLGFVDRRRVESSREAFSSRRAIGTNPGEFDEFFTGPALLAEIVEIEGGCPLFSEGDSGVDECDIKNVLLDFGDKSVGIAYRLFILLNVEVEDIRDGNA
jgi:hypothetical protein